MRMTNQTNKPFPWADQWPEIVDVRVRAAFAVVPRRAFLDAHIWRASLTKTPRCPSVRDRPSASPLSWR
jgi:hypothetical protein